MRLEAEGSPDPADHRVTDAGLRGHRARAPVRLPLGRRLQRLDDKRFDFFVGDLAWTAHARLVVQTFQPPLDEAVTPFAHSLAGGARASSNLGVRHLARLRTCENETGPERQISIRPRPLRELDQLGMLFVGHCQRQLPSSAHDPLDHGATNSASDSVSRGLAGC